jgi:hypothetical protein
MADLRKKRVVGIRRCPYEDSHIDQSRRFDHLGKLTNSDTEEVIAMKVRTTVKAGHLVWGD